MENSIEETKSELSTTKAQCEATILIYKKEIENNEKVIKEYAKERKLILGLYNGTT